MTLLGNGPAGWSRWIRLLGLAVGVGLGVAALLVLPDMASLTHSHFLLAIPRPVRWVLTEWALFWFLLVVGVPLTLRPARILSRNVTTERWARLDDLSSRLIEGPMSPVLMGVCLLMLASWIPHYLTWPWWPDTDLFAVVAQAWDAGMLPYRDIHDFNFPGTTYLHWVLGKLFGWGKTVPLYAFDAALVILLGVTLGSWSRRRFSRPLPGVIGYFVFLGYYLNLDYSLVAQRDWHAALGAVLGLLLLQAWPGRAGRTTSALAFAAALAVRPHAVLFLPALVLAIDEGARPPGGPWRLTLRPLVEWSGVLALGLLLAAAPVLLAGVAGDFVEMFRIAWYGGSYNKASRQGALSLLIGEILDWKTGAVLAANAWLAVRGSPVLRRTARTWTLALLSVLFYRPLSPIAHNYLFHPLVLVWSIGIAPVAEWILSTRRLVPPLKVLSIGVVLMEGVPGIPAYCSILRSAQAVPHLLRGDDPVILPLGCEHVFADGRNHYGHYTWRDYRAVLGYLRGATDPRTRVMNFLRHNPFPAINGPAGRLTAFPCAEGILWLRWVGPALEGRFAEALAQPRNMLVIWDPDATGFEPNMKLEPLELTIRRLYRPEARFGTIEVWRRRSEAASTHPGRSQETGPIDRELTVRRGPSP